MKLFPFLAVVLATCVVACDRNPAVDVATTGELAAKSPTSEKAKIEALIANIEALTDAKFIRNGSDYTAANAAKFLRGKWSLKEKEITTASDFITKAASTSGAGKPYMIKFKDGTEKSCADYLTEQLKKLETPKEK